MSSYADLLPDANDLALEPGGKIKSIQSPDLNAQFETSKETDEHEDHVALRESQTTNPYGIRVSRIAVNPVHG